MKLRALLFVVAMMAVASPAWACLFDTYDFGANCDGWYANGTLRFGDLITERVILTVTLSQGGSVVCSYAETVSVEPSSPSFSFSGGWCTELCGDYVADATLAIDSWYPDTKTFSVPFTCDCEEGGCHYTPGYWKNHPEAWPMSSITIGGITYTQRQAIRILSKPVKGDATIILAHHLIAAKLNVANGADPSIQGVIDQADALLVLYPLFSNPPDPQRQQILDVKDLLCTYNQTILPGCVDPWNPWYVGPQAAPLAPGATEITTWGVIKDIYR